MQVPVTKGRNDFTILARDKDLPPDKGSAPLAVILTVPIPATPTPVPQPSTSTGSARHRHSRPGDATCRRRRHWP